MHDHQARRRFGQNFLIDTQVIGQILAAIAPKPNQHLVEIGPGLGALTQGLAAAAGQLTLVELDRDLFARLQQQFAAQSHVHLIQGDALKVDFTQLAQDALPANPAITTRQIRLIGNLPYNISTPLLFHFFKHAAVVEDMSFMLQREVALRILAAPNTEDYGRLSVMAQFHCRGELLLAVPPEAFKPAPKVHSAVIRLVPQAPPLTDPVAQGCFSDLVRHAFSQRRKTLRNSLRQHLSAEQISAAGIDPGRRAETLSVTDFVALTKLALEQGKSIDTAD